MFQDDILPLIGGMEINEIEPMQILEVIRTRDYSRIEEVITSSVDTWSMRQAEG